jgi:ABC-type amino acid transport substrate-binding protein
MKSLNLLLLSAALTLSAASFSATQITIATDVWEGFSNEDGTGYYTDVFKAIYEPKGIAVVVKYLPYKRARDMLESGNVDVMLGPYKGEQVDGNYSAHPLEMDVVDAAVTPAMAASWQGIESLEGKKVGAISGNEFDQYASVKMQYREVSNLKSLLKMLNHGRIDAVLDYEADIVSMQQKLGDEVSYVIEKGVMKNSGYAVFIKSDHGEKMLNIYNQAYLELHKNGVLKSLLIENTGTLEGYPTIE